MRSSISITEGISHDGFHAGLAPGDRQPARSGPGSARTMTALGYFIPPQKPAAMRTPAASDGPRLRRRESSVADGFLDGGWWPRSRDLSAGLPGLLAALRSNGHD